MTVKQIVEQLNLQVLNNAGLNRPITGGYASDLLSCVMSGAKEGNVWVTLQAHANVIAVASLIGLSAVVITEGIQLDEGTIDKARDEEITLLVTAEKTFAIVGKLAKLGIE
ncbi:MAG: serine kinase [Anaerolineae bacterium]|nr:serine kinase [Anaerolineae bacterium]